MIHIMDYGISASDNCFLVGSVIMRKDKVTGEERETISNPAYATSLKGAFEIIRKKILLEAVRNLDCDLESAVKVIQQKEDEFQVLLNKIKW